MITKEYKNRGKSTDQITFFFKAQFFQFKIAENLRVHDLIAFGTAFFTLPQREIQKSSGAYAPKLYSVNSSGYHVYHVN